MASITSNAPAARPQTPATPPPAPATTARADKPSASEPRPLASAVSAAVQFARDSFQQKQAAKPVELASGGGAQPATSNLPTFRVGAGGTLQPTASSEGLNAKSGAGPVDSGSNVQATSAADGAVDVDGYRALDEVNRAESEYKSASSDVTALNEEMQKELAKFGPALSDTERTKYADEFKKQHHEAYDREARAAKSYGEVVERNLPALEKLSTNGDLFARDQIYDAMKTLAGSSNPRAAVTFGADLAKEDNQALRDAFADYDNLESEVIQPALSNLPGQLLAENGGDTDSAFAQMKEMIDPLAQAGSHYGSPGYKLFKSSPSAIQGAWAALDDASRGKYDKLGELAKTWDGAGSLGGLAKGIASSTLSLGLAAWSVKGGLDDLDQGKLLEAVNAFSGAGKSGLEVSAGAIKALSLAGKAAEEGSGALSFANFATRLAPGLGLIANASSFALDLQKAGKDDNIGYGVAALGDAIGVMGSAIELIPGAQPVGALFGGVGAGVSAVGNLLGNFIEDDKAKEGERQSLKAAGLSDAEIQAMMGSDTGRLKELREDLHLSPAQIRQLGAKYPDLIKDEGAGFSLQTFTKMTRAFGMSGDEAFGMLMSVTDGTEDAQSSLFSFLRGLDDYDFGTPSTPEQWHASLEKFAQKGGARQADYRRVFSNADQYLSNLVRGDRNAE